MGGILLHRGYAAEMATGEGKTLVATLPTLLNAMTHKGVHIMTVNDYLSRRDYELTRPIYMFHGLAVGCIEKNPVKSKAYRADITFGTNSEFTFDYLRDHMALSPDEILQTGHNFAIIDELDSILIDEADTPHIISGGDIIQEEALYKELQPLIEELIADKALFTAEKLKKTASFTTEGIDWLRKRLEEPELFAYLKKYQISDFEHLTFEQQQKEVARLSRQNALVQLLHAYTVYERDTDYIVYTGKIQIIDPYTGRPKPTHRWEHGLHTAIEVKENVTVQPDYEGMAVISLKNYFKLYTKVAGMTGTAMSVAEELKQVYGLKTAAVPTHKEMIRKDQSLRMFGSVAEKDRAIVAGVKRLHKAGRPVLIGCINGQRVESVCRLMDAEGLPYNRLDAKTLDREAYYVSHAGEMGMITISTSIAGRGTDIKLDNEARNSGGLAVVGTDLFSSSRVDCQLKGRSGRQGDPGSSQFFASAEDSMVELLEDADRERLRQLLVDAAGEGILSDEAASIFVSAQAKCETLHEERRKAIASKDDTIAPYRKTFYTRRNDLLLHPESVRQVINEIITTQADKEAVEKHLTELYATYLPIWQKLGINARLQERFLSPFVDNGHTYLVGVDLHTVSRDFGYFKEEYARQVVLLAYDKYWTRFVQHLLQQLDNHEMEQLPSDIDRMNADISYVVKSRLLTAEIPISPLSEAESLGRTEVHGTDTDSDDGHKATTTIVRQPMLPDMPCPCGSGKRYCECHGRNIRNRRRR